jgi:hypothetical protein
MPPFGCLIVTGDRRRRVDLPSISDRFDTSGNGPQLALTPRDSVVRWILTRLGGANELAFHAADGR